jgi:hypothetical protein
MIRISLGYREQGNVDKSILDTVLDVSRGVGCVFEVWSLQKFSVNLKEVE